jgi:F-type H+-transporting ATPase subunit b
LKKFLTALPPAFVALLLALALLVPGATLAQAQLNPIATGSAQQKADAGASNNEEEGYRHSSTVGAIARVLHVPVETAAKIFEDFNSAVLILVVGYYLAKFLPKAFRARREKISKDLVDARSATEIANQRLAAVESRLAMLDTEIEGIRRQAAEDSKEDEQRIRESLEAERERIVRAAGHEIDAAQAAAQRELKTFAANLAIERAIERIHLSDEQDHALIDEFTQSLAGQLSLKARNGGQN